MGFRSDGKTVSAISEITALNIELAAWAPRAFPFPQRRVLGQDGDRRSAQKFLRDRVVTDFDPCLFDSERSR